MAAAKQQKKGKQATVPFESEYVTSAVSVLKGDGIVVHVVNDNSAPAQTQVVIYQNTGAGAVKVVDTGVVNVIPTWTWGLGYTIPESGEYWLRIRASTEFLVPQASFERTQQGIWVPVVIYKPGDFAIFRLLPVRKRVW
jgi:hypothetical protein